MDNIEGIKEKVEKALESMRPFLRADGGDVELVDISEDMVASIKLLGNCESCEMSDMTMKAGIIEGIKEAAPQVKKIVAVNK